MIQVNFCGNFFVGIESEKNKNIYINPFFQSFLTQKNYKNSIVILTDNYLKDSLSYKYNIAPYFCVSSERSKNLLLEKTNLSEVFIKTYKEAFFGNIFFQKIKENPFEYFNLFIEGKKILYVGDLSICSHLFEFYNNFEKIDLLVFPLKKNSKEQISKVLDLIKFLLPKQVLPLNFFGKDGTLFAKEVMLKNLSVPKILRAGQYIVI